MTEASGQEPWHVTVREWTPIARSERAWQPRRDLTSAALVAVGIALTGSVVGLVWPHVAPSLSLSRLVPSSEKPLDWQFGPDAWFLLLAALAGAIGAIAVYVMGLRGPGAMLGLAVGGSGAAAIAARVGFLAERAHTASVFRVGRVNPAYFDILQFKLRATGVAAAWPIAAVAVFAIIVAVRDGRSSLP